MGVVITGMGVGVSIVSVFIALLIQQRKTATAWGELTATLRDLKQYFEVEQQVSKERYKEVCGRLDEHDDTLAEHQTAIEILKVKGK